MGVALLAALVAHQASTSAQGASAATVISATVPSATNLSTAGCGAGSPALEFGVTLPGAKVTTPASCTVTFGSSNDTARLRLFQSDRYGDAMHLPARGPLDTGWGTASGATIEPVGPGTDSVRGMAVAQDGSVFVAAFTNDGGAWPVRLMKFDSTGALDPLFGAGGVVVTPMEGDAANRYEIGVAVQDDGKVVVGGYRDGATDVDFAAARYLPTNGALDPSFGTAGVATIPVGPSTDWAHDVDIDSQGRIVLTGASINGPNIWDFSAARLHPDGSLDTSFGTNGVFLQDGPTGLQWDFVYESDIDAAGRIMLIGPIGTATGYDMGVLRLGEDGAVDLSYGVNGWHVESPGTTWNMPQSGSVDSAGGLVVTGVTWNGSNYDSVAYRLTDTGSIDNGWGAAGWYTRAVGHTSWLDDVLVLADDSVVLGGNETIAGVGQRLLVKLTASGQVDPSFGTSGIDLLPLGAAGATIDEIDHWRDGSIVAAGSASGADVDAGLTLHEGTPVNDYEAGTEDWSSGGNGMFAACLEGATSATVAAGWVAAGAGNCTTSDAAPWRAVADDAAAPTGLVATANPANTTTATASFRWGFRPALAQPPGRYLAPIVFDVVAP